jgi:hypothetical protein
MKYFLIICLCLFSCARIPVQTISLSEVLKDETDRMHLLNVTLLNKMFSDKIYLVNEFIRTEYTPAYLENFKSKLPSNTDYKADFAEMMEAIYPAINATKDSLVSVLEEQRTNIVNKLNLDYKIFHDAFTDMQNLLKSANKLNKQQENVYTRVKSLSGNRLDLTNIDKALNNFITKGGDISGNAMMLTNTIQSLLK